MSDKPTQRELGIIMSAESVRAILAGNKTQTRRVVKPQPLGEWKYRSFRVKPPCACGDGLWVREKWCNDNGVILYAADGCGQHDPMHYYDLTWKSPLFLPRRFSRIALAVVGVQVQRLQDISDADLSAEGWPQEVAELNHWLSPEDKVRVSDKAIAREWFINRWDGLNARSGYGWDVNPWVWVIEFRRVQP